MKLDRKMLILLGVILAASSAYIYLGYEGFSQYANHLEYMQQKYGTSTLCDPCYDPNCTTQYPLDQADCSNSGSIPAPKYNPFDFAAYGTSTSSGSGTTAGSSPRISSSLYDQLKSEILALFPKRQPSSDILISFAPTGSDAAPKPTDAGAPTSKITDGASGNLQMDKLPSPVIAPSGGQMNSPAISQGAGYNQDCPYNMNEYIRKDSIPCYACNIR